MRDRAVGRERERMLSNGNSNFEMKGDVNVGKFQKEHGLGETLYRCLQNKPFIFGACLWVAVAVY